MAGHKLVHPWRRRARGDDLHDILDEVRVVDSRLQGDDGAPWELDKLLLALSAAE